MVSFILFYFIPPSPPLMLFLDQVINGEPLTSQIKDWVDASFDELPDIEVHSE